MGFITIEITPSLEDGLKILQSGLLGVGFPLGQMPQEIGSGSGSVSRSSSAMSSTSAGSPSSDVTAAASTAPGPQCYVAVRFMYPGQEDSEGIAETELYTGSCGIPNIQLNNGSITISISAYPESAVLAALEGTVVFPSGTNALDALKTLVDPMGMTIEFDDGDSETEAILQNKPVTGVWNEPRFEIAKRIIRSADCYFDISTSKMIIKSRSFISNSDITYTFVQFRNINPNENVFPLSDYELESPRSLFMHGGVFGSFQKDFTSDSKESEDFTVDSSDYDSQSLGGSNTGPGSLPKDSGAADEVGGATGIKTTDAQLTGGGHLVLSRGAAGEINNKGEIRAKMNQTADSFVKVKMTSPGVPRLKPLTVAQVIIGDNIPGLSSPVLINVVEHVWDGSGWTTEIEARQMAATTAAAVSNDRPIEPQAQPSGPTRTPTRIPS